MVEILDQKEIDRLMTMAMSPDESGESLDSTHPALGEEPVDGRKYFTPPKRNPIGFEKRYKTPLLKRRKIIYNPPTEIEENPLHCTRESPVVVRTLDNYNQMIEKRNQYAKRRTA
ncbi:MAG: hypothetical protein Q8P15_02025 [Nanoarchaeota archaeon]|nr:hypothetical protein [Nanoarchaeota archaeon]